MSILSITRDALVLHARLDDGAKNVITLDIATALLDLVSNPGEANTLILEGNPSALSVGLDTKTVLAGGPDADALLSTMGEVLKALYLSDLRSIIVAAGHATAAGAMLLLTADRRIGYGPGGKVGLSEVRVGLDVPRPTQQLIRDRIAVPHHYEATALGTLYDYDQAGRIGFFDHRVDDHDTALEIARAEADRLSALPRDGYLKTKQTMRADFAALF